MTSKNCATCKYVDMFTPRLDEIQKGHTMGCKKSGYEGYVNPERPACGGTHYRQAIQDIDSAYIFMNRELLVSALKYYRSSLLESQMDEDVVVGELINVLDGTYDWMGS